MDDIFERVKELTVEELGVSADMVTPDASFVDDLEADSLDLMQLMMAIEEEFDLDELEKQLIKSFISLEKDQRQTITQFLQNAINQ